METHVEESGGPFGCQTEKFLENPTKALLDITVNSPRAGIKIQTLDPYGGANPKKLHSFLYQCKMYF